MPGAFQLAVVLRAWDYSESSQVVSLFTAEQGRVRLLAKGTRRQTRTLFAPGIDLAEMGEVAFRLSRGGSELGTLTNWHQVEVFPGLRRDLPRLYLALYALELTWTLTAELDPHPGLFVALVDLLEAAATEPRGELPSRAVRFQARLLRAIGLAPNLRTCSTCGRPRDPGRSAFFSPASGGLLCRRCAPQVPDKQTVKARLLDAAPGQAEPQAWFHLLDYHLRYHAGRPFRTGAGVRRVFAGLLKTPVAPPG